MSKKVSELNEMKGRSKVRTKEEERKIAIFWQQTKSLVRIYKDIGIEKKTDIKRQRARAHARHIISLPFWRAAPWDQDRQQQG